MYRLHPEVLCLLGFQSLPRVDCFLEFCDDSKSQCPSTIRYEHMHTLLKVLVILGQLLQPGINVGHVWDRYALVATGSS